MIQVIKTFRRIVKAEIAKLKGTFAIWLTLAYPLGTVLLVTLFWIGMRNQKNVNTDSLVNNLGNIASFFLPFFIVLIISFACNSDHKNSMLKHILALPVPRYLYYVGKLTGIIAFIGIACILTFVFAYCSILICGIISPKLGFGTSFNHGLLVKIIIKAYIASAAIYTLQFWMGMRLRNLTLPVAIGSALILLPIAVLIIMGITGLINDSSYFVNTITYNPYSNAFASAFSMMKPAEISYFSTPTYIFILLSLIALVLGAWEFNRRNI
jgi:hypothetical protein